MPINVSKASWSISRDALNDLMQNCRVSNIRGVARASRRLIRLARSFSERPGSALVMVGIRERRSCIAQFQYESYLRTLSSSNFGRIPFAYASPCSTVQESSWDCKSLMVLFSAWIAFVSFEISKLLRFAYSSMSRRSWALCSSFSAFRASGSTATAAGGAVAPTVESA